MWVAVFAVSAGVGAFIASRTNPFPPGVEDPGARPVSTTASPTAEPTPAGTPLLVSGGAATRHDLFVGGSCSSDWDLALHVTVDDAGKVSGTGVWRLRGRLRCDFPTAQTQARLVRLLVGGHRSGDELDLRLDVAKVDPTGSDDYGGLLKTLQRFPTVPMHGDAGTVTSTEQVPDGDLGSYVATYRIRVRPGAG